MWTVRPGQRHTCRGLCEESRTTHEYEESGAATLAPVVDARRGCVDGGCSRAVWSLDYRGDDENGVALRFAYGRRRTVSALDSDWVARYATGPSDTTVQQAISLHSNVRGLLSEGPYDTILQGSYKNDTALADMNDVDILAIRSDLTKEGLGWLESISWEGIFSDIEQRLGSDQRYAGKATRRDKCIALATGIKLDIVPAVGVVSSSSDPVLIHSFAGKTDRRNWPRGHYENGAAKNGRTNGAFKPLVRLFKRWARAQFPNTTAAPSYYLECLIHSLPDGLFSGGLATDFMRVSDAILSRHGGLGGYNFKLLPRIAGEGDLLNGGEWRGEAFDLFIDRLRASLPHAIAATTETAPDRAKAAWRMVFAGHDS